MSEVIQFGFINGEFKQVESAAISVTNRGLMYGDGCFETFCAYQGQFFKLSEHLQRLKAGLDYLNIDYPEKLTFGKIQPVLQQLLQRNNLMQTDAIIRVQVWRTGSRGYTTDSRHSGFAVIASAHPQKKKSYHLCTVPTRRIPSAALPAKYKFTNGLNYIIAAREAHNKGADDALMQTMDNVLSETTVANIFWLTDDQVFTPSEECDVLAGITRDEIIRCLTKRMNRRVETGRYQLDEIIKADAVWICNSVKEVAPVKQIDNTYFNISNPFLNKLQAAFQSHIRECLSEGT